MYRFANGGEMDEPTPRRPEPSASDVVPENSGSEKSRRQDFLTTDKDGKQYPTRKHRRQ
jgi:hypothetical protein